MKDNWLAYRLRHEEGVKYAQKTLGGIAFWSAPFDLIDKEGRFIDVKVRISSAFCKLTITRDELKFAKVKPLWIFLIENGNNYLFLLDEELKNRLEPLKEYDWGGSGHGFYKGLTLGEKFLGSKTLYSSSGMSRFQVGV